MVFSRLDNPAELTVIGSKETQLACKKEEPCVTKTAQILQTGFSTYAQKIPVSIGRYELLYIDVVLSYRIS